MNWCEGRSNYPLLYGTRAQPCSLRSILHMNRTIFFSHYRQASAYDGSPVELSRIGAATIHKASDLRSGAPVVLTLLPIESVAPEQRDQFEKDARALLQLEHLNIVRTVEFGREGEDFAFVSEDPQGETLADWVANNGPMPPDAVLRVALQVMSALAAASFQGISHRGIEPSNIMIVSGQTAEGGWPFVKLMNLPAAGLMPGGEGTAAAEFLSPEQLKDGTVDFRSEVYSLGATICFLLTGAFYSAEPRSLQTRRFARLLRKLITPMLRQNPAERPQNPELVAQELRSCLQRVERRQALSTRFGIPFVPVVLRPMPKRRAAAAPQSILAAAFEKPVARLETYETNESVAPAPRVWLRRGLSLAALLLAVAMVAALLLPTPVSMLVQRKKDIESIGVPVGIAQESFPVVRQNTPAPSVTNEEPTSPHGSWHSAAPVAPTLNDSGMAAEGPATTAPSQVAATSGTLSSLDKTTNSPTPEPAAASLVSRNDHVADPAPPSAGPQTVWERMAGGAAQPRVARRDEASAAAQTEAAPADEASDRSNESKGQATDSAAAAVNSRSRKTNPIRASNARALTPVIHHSERLAQAPSRAPRGSTRPVIAGSVRARFAGMTRDGSLVLRFPNGETAIVPPPPGVYVPSQLRIRRSRRVIIERRVTLIPPDA